MSYIIPQNVSLANSEDPDEMPYNAAFHQGLRCLLRQKKTILRRNTILSRHYNPWPLKLYNEPSKVYCVKSEGRIHLCVVCTKFPHVGAV